MATQIFGPNVDQVFDQIFGQGFDQGFWNPKIQCTGLPGRRNLQKSRKFETFFIRSHASSR